MDPQEDVPEKIASFPRWHYQFDLMGHLTPIFSKDLINRHAQRKKYFLEPLVSWFGGSLKGKRVLDLGCNAGFWSLCAVQAGCDYVLGIDGRQMHIDQANFVFQVHSVKSTCYDFVVGNVLDIDLPRGEKFDIVLCLGLFYHINRHVELLTKVSSVNSDVLIIDTSLIRMRESFFHVYNEDLAEPRNAVDCSLVYCPTAQAVLDLVGVFGYSTIILRPSFDNYEGADGYRLGRRRAFVCAKRSNLGDFPASVETVADLATLYVGSQASQHLELYRCRDELAAILASRSWKLTEPLRLIYDFLTKILPTRKRNNNQF